MISHTFRRRRVEYAPEGPNRKIHQASVVEWLFMSEYPFNHVITSLVQ